MNGIRINEQKIDKFLGERTCKIKDTAYTHEVIKKLIDAVDIRVKIIILLMASTGMRVGAVSNIQLKHEEIEGLYKVTVYEKSKEEYFTFCTPECYSYIKQYLEFRTKSGEILDKESYLIREQFDINDFEQIRRKSRKITTRTIRNLMQKLAIRTGLRTINPTNGVRTGVNHGLRKFFTTQVTKARVNHEMRELWLGHEIKLASAYYRPTVAGEYSKAINLLTINEENSLKEKVKFIANEVLLMYNYISTSYFFYFLSLQFFK